MTELSHFGLGEGRITSPTFYARLLGGVLR